MVYHEPMTTTDIDIEKTDKQLHCMRCGYRWTPQPHKRRHDNPVNDLTSQGLPVACANKSCRSIRWNKWPGPIAVDIKGLETIHSLSKKDQIIRLREENPDLTLVQIGDEVGVSRERVRQVLSENGLQTKAIRFTATG